MRLDGAPEDASKSGGTERSWTVGMNEWHPCLVKVGTSNARVVLGAVCSIEGAVGMNCFLTVRLSAYSQLHNCEDGSYSDRRRL